MSESTELVVIRTFSTVPEAQFARSVVAAAGIPNELADDNIIAADWLYSNAVGGVKLLVPEDRAEEAVALLDTPAEGVGQSPATEQPIDPANMCAACGGSDFEVMTQGRRWTMLTWLVFSVPLVPVHHVRRCRQCGTISQRGDAGIHSR